MPSLQVCAPAHYLADDGSCAACPRISGLWSRYAGVVYILVGILAFVVVIYGLLHLLAIFTGGSLAGGVGHMATLAVWSLTTMQVRCAAGVAHIHASVFVARSLRLPTTTVAELQVVSQAASVQSPSLPGFVRRLYGAVAVLQFEGVLLPPACTGA